LPPANRNLTASAAKAGVTGKRARFGWVMRQGWARTRKVAFGVRHCPDWRHHSTAYRTVQGRPDDTGEDAQERHSLSRPTWNWSPPADVKLDFLGFLDVLRGLDL